MHCAGELEAEDIEDRSSDIESVVANMLHRKSM
jgi:hypothetical protein